MGEWFKDWFSSEEYLNVYQHRDDDDARKLLNLILSNVKLSANSKILDAACGAGRHSINLALKGFNVVGFDLSKQLLKKAAEEIRKKSVHVDLFCADIRKVYLKEKFDLIVNLFTSFGYFDNDVENFRFPEIAYSLLNKNGFYILDYLNERFVKKNLVAESAREVNGKLITEKRRIEKEKVIKEIFIHDGINVQHFLESVTLYPREKIIKEFENIGFKLEKYFGDYDGSSFDENNSKRLILFFRK